MKRGRISDTERKGTEPGELSHILSNYSGPSFSDFPKDIMVNVLLRLSIKRIFVCKIVCKPWHDLISEPDFAKLHFNQAEAYPLIQISGHTALSRMLYLVQPEEGNFEKKLEMCDHSDYDSKCDCLVEFELDTKFKLLLRNPQVILDKMPKHVNGVKCKNFVFHMEDHKYSVVNSCNGLLCLSDPSNNDPLVVCNPITGEFINLPETKKVVGTFAANFRCGFGFSPSSNQYKVVRMFQRRKLDVNTVSWIESYSSDGVGVEIHTLGTEVWRDIDSSSREICGYNPTYLNGFLYWPDYKLPFCLLSFDIEKECFSSVSAPPMGEYMWYNNKVSIGVLGGELSISCFLNSSLIGIWVMKDDGTTKVWSQVFSIQLDRRKRWNYDPCRSIKYLNDGALLMFSLFKNSLIYKHPRKHRIRYFQFQNYRKQMVEVFVHIPSFVPLKDALSQHNVKVLKSRFMELKLQSEDKSISIKEMFEVK